MADGTHSLNYYKIKDRIDQIDSLKDIENLISRLEALEQNDEVVELISLAHDKESQIKEKKLEERYNEIVGHFNAEDIALEDLLREFKRLGSYKDSEEYCSKLECIINYNSAVEEMKSQEPDWNKINKLLVLVGDYKDALDLKRTAESHIREKAEAEKLKREQNLEAQYKQALSLMNDPSNRESAKEIFQKLGYYKDSREKIVEIDKAVAEEEKQKVKNEKEKTRKIVLLLLALTVVCLIAYCVPKLISWKSNDDYHWHAIFGNNIRLTEHVFHLEEEVLPTCTDDGYVLEKCEVCKKYQKIVLPATGHISDSGIVTKEPTCTAQGNKIYSCTICGATVKTESIAAKGHVSDEGNVTKEPTCTKAGTKTYSCTICGAVVKTENIAAKGHSFVDTIKTSPQCETRGLADSVCSVCGYSITKVIDATGHDWNMVTSIEPNCLEPGSITYICNVCGKDKVDEVPATGHTWEKYATDNPTCVADGYDHYRCLKCDATKKEVLSATGHNYYDGFCIDCLFDRGEYKIGDVGPAGGYIFYDCDADNNSGNKDGLKSSECGWRFLEVAPTDIKVGSKTKFVFGYFRTSDSGRNLYVNGTTTYNASDCTKIAIGTGKTNTEMLVNRMGDSAYSESSGSSKTSNYAAKLCVDYNLNGYDDWFLPSKDELNLMYKNLCKNGVGSFDDYGYWSSSEYSYGAYSAWCQYFSNGSRSDDSRNDDVRVRAVRAF